MKPEIDMDIGNGFRLVAETNIDDEGNQEIFIGVVDRNDNWVNDLCAVRHRSEGLSGAFQILVWKNPDKDYYTDEFLIPYRHVEEFEIPENFFEDSGLNPIPNGGLDEVLRGE